jgi:hypothetical protein
MELKIIDFAYTFPLPPIPEIFDQYIAIAEVEYRWTQEYRTFPIPGRTLQRLIELNWISRVEISERAAAMDILELQKHNSRQPPYPWKPVHGTMPPTSGERYILMKDNSCYFQHQDAARMADKQEVRRLDTISVLADALTESLYSSVPNSILPPFMLMTKMSIQSYFSMNWKPTKETMRMGFPR